MPTKAPRIQRTIGRVIDVDENTKWGIDVIGLMLTAVNTVLVVAWLKRQSCVNIMTHYVSKNNGPSEFEHCLALGHCQRLNVDSDSAT